MSIMTELGIESPEQAHKDFWKQHGFYQVNRANGKIKITPSIQSMFSSKENRQNAAGFWKINQLGLDPENYEKAQRRELRESDLDDKPDLKTVDSGVAETPTPLVFDPEILEILKSDAPLTMRLPERGQQGYEAVFNRIDSRDSPIGFVDEATSLDLTSQSKDFSITRDKTAMEIWVDAVEVAEFSERASAHYMNLRDTALGARVSEHAQQKEKAILYADPSQTTGTGGIGDTNAYDGLAQKYTETSKTSTDIGGTKGLLKDVKSEIKSLLQGQYAVSKADLEIWTSHTVFDHLENEADVSARRDADDQTVNFGMESINISQVPAFPSHLVDSHTDGGYTPGAEGDVFIVNTRAAEYRSLMPLSTVPLGTAGFGSRVAMGEFGALIERSGGNFGKYLSDYQV